ncbi:hypothetical protein SAMN05216376_102316 [Mameliella alba]|uniref:hypothetical protein n=1 Tax=Mameliella alba TaxID=561184 RepID=UPI0008907FF2|nr:hypothetical protein [Mameliella alba]OWV49549.1 hypothetical protein CDZ96_03995 [Mameliella alba]PTR41524.1 hypothetical protein LX94_00815 [Mameliella alba]GGF52259.1 hypothetical protein GCM10011319_12170 [Mameliella alba]SDC39386.1 hypothetical protein SAMN05216376_102316 [Mameliella alba]
MAGGFLLLASTALAQGKMPYEISDEVIYNRRSFDVWFGLYETETVRDAPDTGLPQKEWIEQSRLVVRTNQDPQIGPGDKVLARKVGIAFCRHYGLTVRSAPGDAHEWQGEWSFVDLCWKDGW